jgi:3-oxoadipate enol-lactonase
MKIAANGVELNAQIEGREGAPWLTFSNSLATNMGMWNDQVVALRSDFHILRYDKRGHGDSAAPRGPYPIEMLVDDVIGLWDALGIARSHFVGLSIGGMTGFGLALDHADRLLSMCVCCTRADSPPEYNAAWPGRIAIAEGKGMAALVDSTLERWFTPGFRARAKPEMDRMGRMISTTSVEGYVGCAYALQNLPYLPRLGAIKTPTLCLGGSNDILLEGTRDAHKAIAGSTYVELGPAGHIANIEQPEQFSAAIGAFLAKHKT